MNPLRVFHIAVLASIALLFQACQPSASEYATLDGWLLCDDCRNGERAAVHAIGGKLVHTLDQALIGPSPGRVANKEAQFRQMYRTLPAPSVSESDYVAELRGNYIARYQQRAALSLGDIGDSRAVAALRRARDAARARGYRSDVVTVIATVLALRESRPFAGTVAPQTPRFADTVRVAQGGGLAWDGDESVTLNGTPFADSLEVGHWTDSLAFVAAALPGNYALSIHRLGSGAVTQVVPLQIIAPPYQSHDPATAPVLTALPLPQTRYLALPSSPADSGDFFKLEAAGNRPFTARITAAGANTLSLRWLVCATLAMPPLVAPVTLTGRVVDENGVPVDGALVSLLTTGVQVVTDVSGRFSLSGLPAVPPVDVRVSKLGYARTGFSIQLGVDSVMLPISSDTTAIVLTTVASSVTIPAGGCRFLRITPAAGAPRVIRLRLTSP